jgi:hypothetical protein
LDEPDLAKLSSLEDTMIDSSLHSGKGARNCARLMTQHPGGVLVSLLGTFCNNVATLSRICISWRGNGEIILEISWSSMSASQTTLHTAIFLS